jgi:hypothetical protein
MICNCYKTELEQLSMDINDAGEWHQYYSSTKYYNSTMAEYYKNKYVQLKNKYDQLNNKQVFNIKNISANKD